MLPSARSRDPRDRAPVGAYLRDTAETRLIEVFESDYSGVIGEDLATHEWVEIAREDMAQHWHRVRARKRSAERERQLAALLAL